MIFENLGTFGGGPAGLVICDLSATVGGRFSLLFAEPETNKKSTLANSKFLLQ